MLEFGKKDSTAKYQDRPGAFGICIENNHVLVVKTPTGYFLPGGGLDENENQEDGLKREFLEEIGHQIEPLKKICAAVQYSGPTRGNQYFKKIGHFYLVKIIDEIPQSSENDHIPEWITIEFALKNMHQEFQSWAIEQANSIH